MFLVCLIHTQLFGPGILPHHCDLMHADGLVTITPASMDAETFVDGQRIADTTVLRSGVTVQFGATHVFKFVDPSYDQSMSKRDPGSMMKGRHKSGWDILFPFNSKSKKSAHFHFSSQKANLIWQRFNLHGGLQVIECADFYFISFLFYYLWLFRLCLAWSTTCLSIFSRCAQTDVFLLIALESKFKLIEITLNWTDCVQKDLNLYNSQQTTMGALLGIWDSEAQWTVCCLVEF